VLVSPDALHVCYIHSPMRYAWDLQFAYLHDQRMDRGIKSALLRLLLHRLRIWDYRSAAGVDHFIAASRFVARRVNKAYRRDATVIYPPVDTEFFSPEGTRQDYYVSVARFMPFKRVDLLVEAFARLPERRLVLIGDGPEFGRIRARCPANVELAGRLAPDGVRARVRRARAFVFASVDDFGIAPVEALASGTPVIAYARGGAAETVTDLDAAQPTGVLFRQQSADAVVEAVRKFEANAGRVTAAACIRQAQRFSIERFRKEFAEYVGRAYGSWRASLGLPRQDMPR
jgi:glycosyltransferase involved in cell wall biosynthesis